MDVSNAPAYALLLCKGMATLHILELYNYPRNGESVSELVMQRNWDSAKLGVSKSMKSFHRVIGAKSSWWCCFNVRVTFMWLG